MKFRDSLLFLLLSFIFPRPLAAQQGSYEVSQLNSRNGISNSSVTDLLQDRDDLLWLATWDGLNVYDGSSFHVFNYAGHAALNSIGSNVIKQVAEDVDGSMWIATIEGLSNYNKTTGEFHHYFYRLNHKKSIGGTEFMIAIDHLGNVFCLSKAQGLFRYDRQTGQFSQVTIPGGQNPLGIKFDQKNRLWARGQDGALQIYDYQNSKLTIRHAFFLSDRINNFFVLKNGIFLTTDKKKLYMIDADLQLRFQCNLQNEAKAMVQYKDDYLFAWSNGGCQMLSSDFKKSDLLGAQLGSLETTKITAILSDRNGILWLATDGSGVIKIAPERRLFGRVTSEMLRQDGALKQVRAFCEIGNDLWVGTKGNGITILKNYSPDKETPYQTAQLHYPQTLNNNSVYSIFRGNEDLVYIGTDGRGLCLFDIVGQRFISWDDVENIDKFPSFGAVYAIIQDEDNSVWLGTSGHGLIHLKLSKQANGKIRLTALQQFVYNGTNRGPGNDIIYCLQKGRNGRIWLGCRYGGLSVLDQRSNTFRTFRAFSYDGSLSHNDILSLHLDINDRLWIGTSYGLNRINEKDVSQDKVVFTKLSVTNGLPNNTIHAITDDRSGYLWVSTNNGLAKINQQTLQVERFREQDGLQSNEFSDGAAWKNKNGYILFGGLLGFNVFKPLDVNKSEPPPNILLTGLQLGNQAFNDNGLSILHPDQKKAPSYELKPGDNYFEVNLKTVDFLNNEKMDYAYQLIRYDKSWQYKTETGRIKYTNLPIGKYALKIKWSDRTRQSSVSIIAFNIKVVPYFWNSGAAKMLYSALLLTGSYFIFRYRKKRVEFKRKLEMEHLLRLKEEELHEQQLGFFTNIAHELRTPLTLINGSVERFFHKADAAYKRTKEQQFLSIIHRQSSRLTYLVNQLMDFRKLEAGHLKCQPSYFNISILLSGIAELFMPLAEQKSIDYQINIPENINGWLDKDKLEKIVFNILSNAFKHSADGQCVTFQVVQKDNTVEFWVSNTGTLLDEEAAKHIFDQFFVAENATGELFSSGIGLSFTRQLVELLSGTITLDNRNGVVTFLIRLPLMNQSSDEPIEKTGVKPIYPSYLLRAITAGSEKELVSIGENNKRSLIANLEDVKRQSVLIVDDESAMRFLLKDLLEEFFVVYEAETGRQAIELLKVFSVDLIISDVTMPDVNGLELCTKVKNTPETCHLPFILLSAKGEMEQKTEGYDAGADAYIPKPFDTQHLMVRVKRLLEYRIRLHNLFNKGVTDTQLADKNMSGDDRQFLTKVVEIIEANIEDPLLDAAFLESRLALSRMQLYRRMKTLSNMPPVEFIKHLRLQRAIKLLETSTLSVNEVFYRSGFNNQSHFFREFKKRYGCSPNEYRYQQRISL